MKVALVGSCGYIGSMLHRDLAGLYSIECFDSVDQCMYPPHVQIKASEIDITEFDVILYFAGISRKSDCEITDYDTLYDTNVTELIRLVEKMNEDQVCIYASTGSLYYNQSITTEKDAIDLTRLQQYEKVMFARENAVGALGKRTIGLRMGTVIGQSPNIRPELLYNGLYYSAFSFGQITVWNPTSWRCILWYQDLFNVIECILKEGTNFCGPTLFNIGSFNARIGDIAIDVSEKTGSTVSMRTLSTDTGFQMNCDMFTRQFGYVFKGSKDVIHNEYVTHKNEFIQKINAPTGRHVKCLICRNTSMKSVIDLGIQPLANNFTAKNDRASSYPLHVYRCRHCTHTQLGYFVERDVLFRDYIYESGTSSTLRNYFKSFAEAYSRKIDVRDRTVLELACNDGYQLDEFKALGWKTYGIDPAANQIDRARANGHIVDAKFWGVESTAVLEGVHLDLIVAENVLAHVTNPIGFLQTCASVMDTDTLLVVQTSQANMYANNEFDAIYHEHVSFFTIQSMVTAAKNAGCTVVNVYKTPIHGVSYVFEIKKGVFSAPELLCLKDEIKRGLYTDSFYSEYSAVINRIKTHSLSVLQDYVSNGYSIIGYGAAAKGNVFLNYIFDSQSSRYAPEYIIDDSALKHGKYTAGTHIEVTGYDRLQHYLGKKVLVVILAWNFAGEIRQRIRDHMPQGVEYKCLQFFPSLSINDCTFANKRDGQSPAEVYSVHE